MKVVNNHEIHESVVNFVANNIPTEPVLTAHVINDIEAKAEHIYGFLSHTMISNAIAKLRTNQGFCFSGKGPNETIQKRKRTSVRRRRR